MAGASDDNYNEMLGLVSDTNYFWLQGASKNQVQVVLTDSIFTSVNMTILPTRAPDGSIDMQGLFELVDTESVNSGALLEPTPEVINIIAGHWIEAVYKKLVAKGIIEVDLVRDVKDLVTRGNMVSYLIKALVPDLSDDADPLQYAIDNGWIKGYPDKTYKMDSKLSREQAMVIAARMLKERDNITLNDVDFSIYEDLNNISSWTKEDFYYVVKAGVVKGKSLKTLNPKDEITFAELLQIISNVNELLGL